MVRVTGLARELAAAVAVGDRPDAGHARRVVHGAPEVRVTVARGLDQQDLYLEELNPSNPLQYKTDDGWEPMPVEKETFAILGGPPVELEVQAARKQTLPSRVLGAIALERLTGRKADPGRLNELK